jgi:hypothetical protein
VARVTRTNISWERAGVRHSERVIRRFLAGDRDHPVINT